MKKIFVNFTNHPSDFWDEKQKKEALGYGEIVDISFPVVNASGDETYIQKLAKEYVDKIVQYQPQAVLCQGEFNLCYQVVSALKERKIKVMAACSQRMVTTQGNRKEVIFVFERFRQY